MTPLPFCHAPGRPASRNPLPRRALALARFLHSLSPQSSMVLDGTTGGTQWPTP